MRRLAPLVLVPVLLLSACGGSDVGGPDPALTDPASPPAMDQSEVAPDPALTDPSSEQPPADGQVDGAAGSCLAGDPDCTDESYDGTDQAAAIPVSDTPPAGEPIPTGTSDTATGQRLTGASVDGATLTVGWEGSPCDVLVDPMVIADDAEVRLLVLAGPESGTEACIQSIQPWTTTIELDAPLGDRALLDLGG